MTRTMQSSSPVNVIEDDPPFSTMAGTQEKIETRETAGQLLLLCGNIDNLCAVPGRLNNILEKIKNINY